VSIAVATDATNPAIFCEKKFRDHIPKLGGMRPPACEGRWCGRRDSNPHNFRHWNLPGLDEWNLPTASPNLGYILRQESRLAVGARQLTGICHIRSRPTAPACPLMAVRGAGARQYQGFSLAGLGTGFLELIMGRPSAGLFRKPRILHVGPSSSCGCLVFLVSAAHHDLERVVRQWSL